MARFEHGLAQSALSDEVQVFKRRGVPDYWISSPEDRTLIAYTLEVGGYHVIFSANYPPDTSSGRVRVPPFEAAEIDLGFVFGIAV